MGENQARIAFHGNHAAVKIRENKGKRRGVPLKTGRREVGAGVHVCGECGV